MSRRKQPDTPVEVEKVEEEVVRVTVPQTHVTLHLNRDLNDPRNRPETKLLPSLDD